MLDHAKNFWGWVVISGLQIIAITLCAMILMNMAIEDEQPPKPATVCPVQQ
jgi:hypothetical protein